MIMEKDKKIKIGDILECKMQTMGRCHKTCLFVVQEINGNVSSCIYLTPPPSICSNYSHRVDLLGRILIGVCFIGKEPLFSVIS